MALYSPPQQNPLVELFKGVVSRLVPPTTKPDYSLPFVPEFDKKEFFGHLTKSSIEEQARALSQKQTQDWYARQQAQKESQKALANLAIDMFPGVGDVKAIVEGAAGRTVLGEPLAWWERGLSAVSGAIPFVPSTVGMAKAAKAWYYPLQKVIEEKMPARAPVEQIRGLIRGAGVKEDELKWSGLDEILGAKQGSVDKGELLKHLRENQVELREVVRRDIPKDDYLLKKEYRMDPKTGAKFPQPQWQLPGAQEGSYRELELVWPKGEFTSTHYPEEKGLLAHVRFNDRIDAQGKKVLFIEEVQSDWHQAGRERGYQQPRVSQDELDRLYNEFRSAIKQYGIQSPQVEAANKAFDEALMRGEIGVPPAPFSKTWHELAMRRTVRWAAENGYDRVAWTTGTQQAERYNQMLKDITRVGVLQQGNDLWNITIKNRLGETVLNKIVHTSDLKATVGSNVTNDILTSKGERILGETVRVLNYPEGITIGGEGMKGFYDKMIPEYMNKFGKKWGERIKGDISKVDPKAYSGDYQPHIDINPSMRESVLKEGLPLFQGVPLSLGSQQWFEERRKKRAEEKKK